MTLIKGRYKGADGDQQIPVKVDRNGQIAVEFGGMDLTAIISDLDVIAAWNESGRSKVNLIVGQEGISAAAGAVASNTPRVTLASNDPAVAALAVLGNWDESDRVKVNLIAGEVGISAAAGTVVSNTPRVTLASNDPAVTSLAILDDWDESDRCKVTDLQSTKSSAVNSTSTNLDPGDSFLGSGVATAGYSSISVMCTSDQILEIQVQQSTDNSNWDIRDTFLAYPEIPRGRIFQAVGAYARVQVTNISPTATTFIRLSTLLCPISNTLPRALTPIGTLALSKQTSSFSPDIVNFSVPSDVPPLKIDIEGNLGIRGQVLTDERSFRDDFTGGDIVFSLSGTLTFKDSVYVTGTSTSFLSEIKVGDYIKLDTDLEYALTIVSDVVSDTLLILEENYLGTPGAGAASRSNWAYAARNGASFTYTSTEIEINSGASNNGRALIYRSGDYGPFSISFAAKLSNRRANQEADLGLVDDTVTIADRVAVVRFTGTDDTKVSFVTGMALADRETTEITLPNAGVTSSYHTYLIVVLGSEAYLCVDNVRVTTHTRHIPGPYDAMDFAAGIFNSGVVAGSSTLTVDTAFFSNYNQVVTGDPTGIHYSVNPYPNTSTVTSVVAAVADTEIAAARSSRSGAAVYNDSTAVLYLKLGTGASPTSYTVKVRATDYFEVPYGYIGTIHGYWEAANGAARVTEVY